MVVVLSVVMIRPRSNMPPAPVANLTIASSLAFLPHRSHPLTRLPFIGLSLLSIISVAFAQPIHGSVKQIVTVEVRPIAVLRVTGNPAPLMVQKVYAGEDVSVSDQHSQYSIATNLDNVKIVASINSSMPSGTRLKINLASGRASSVGDVDISAALVPVDVVTGIGRGSDRDQSIRYTFVAGSGVGGIDRDERLVTLTLTD